MYTTAYHPTIQRNETLSFVATRMNLEDTRLSEINQEQGKRNAAFSHSHVEAKEVDLKEVKKKRGQLKLGRVGETGIKREWIKGTKTQSGAKSKFQNSTAQDSNYTHQQFTIQAVFKKLMENLYYDKTMYEF